MNTLNLYIDGSWTQVADSADISFYVSWKSPVSLEISATINEQPPIESGHLIHKEMRINRSFIGSGYVWLRTAVGSFPACIPVTVSKSREAIAQPVYVTAGSSAIGGGITTDTNYKTRLIKEPLRGKIIAETREAGGVIERREWVYDEQWKFIGTDEWVTI